MRKLALLLAGLTAFPSAALADLEICNDTAELQVVALGYKGAQDWTSEGWWRIAPGNCEAVINGPLKRRYYYYFSASASGSFIGQDYYFCTDPSAFTIVGDTECAERGYNKTEFKEVDTGPTATSHILRISKPGVEKKPADLPSDRLELSRASIENEYSAFEPILADNPAGKYGEAAILNAVFQGCELVSGRSQCSFYQDGIKYRTFYGGPTPDHTLFALENVPILAPVTVEADIVEQKGNAASIVLRSIASRQDNSAFGNALKLMQGDWRLSTDRSVEISILGMEIFERQKGSFREARQFSPVETCGGDNGEGVLVKMARVGKKRSKCYEIAELDAENLVLKSKPSGPELHYHKIVD